jgi:hypothetical protein
MNGTENNRKCVAGLLILSAGAGDMTTEYAIPRRSMPYATPAATNLTYDYFVADANIRYTVDDRNGGTRGLEKWTFNGQHMDDGSQQAGRGND